MSGNVVGLNVAQGSYLMTVSFYRMPDGSVRARIDDMPTHVIEEKDTLVERFTQASGWCLAGCQDFLRQAVQFDPDSQEGRA